MLSGLKKKFAYYRVNKVYAGTNPKHWEKKRKILNSIGHDIGEGTKIVGPVLLQGTLHTGKNAYINLDFSVLGLGHVYIGDNCDVAPKVTCLTGSHKIGDASRRAGEGTTDDIKIGSGSWICAKSTIIGGSNIGKGVVVSAGSVVNKDTPDDVLIGGVPAKVIKLLENKS